MSHPHYTPHPQSVGYKPGVPVSARTDITKSYTKPPTKPRRVRSVPVFQRKPK